MRTKFKLSLILIISLFIVFSSAPVMASPSIAERLKGRILLQVESHGEVYYVNPATAERYYMENGDAAYNIMRNFGIGITNADLEKIKSDKTLALKHKGKIFLQVESHGEAYYVDFSGNLHYLKDGSEAYNIMRTLGLGITNNDLAKINISEKSINQNINSGQEGETATNSPVNSACTSWVYSDWGKCTSGQQTRTIISSFPSSCAVGTPLLSQSCATQTSSCSSWTYSDWSSCQSSGMKTRSIISSSPGSCYGGNPILSESCTYIYPTCTSWTYSDWGTCSRDGQQTRDVTSSSPNECINGNPILNQSCTYTPSYVMPDKPIIESLCDNKGYCVSSHFADTNINSWQSSFPIVHVGDVLNFTIKVGGQETENIYSYFIGTDGAREWVQNSLTFTKTFTRVTSQDSLYVYIKSQNNNYHRIGCVDGVSCDDYTALTYTVLP